MIRSACDLANCGRCRHAGGSATAAAGGGSQRTLERGWRPGGMERVQKLQTARTRWLLLLMIPRCDIALTQSILAVYKKHWLWGCIRAAWPQQPSGRDAPALVLRTHDVVSSMRSPLLQG